MICGLFLFLANLKGVSDVTINLFFLTLTIQRRFKSPEEYEREYEIEQMYNEMKDLQLKYLYLNSQR